MDSPVAGKFLRILVVLLLLQQGLLAQRTITKSTEGSTGTSTATPPVTYDSQGKPIKNRANGKNDSLQKRDRYEDSITIYFRYFDSSRIQYIDSSINDYSTRFPRPYWHVNLGNTGTASKSLLFSPILKAGWDAGFHQYDIYSYTVEGTKFYQTTRPYTELTYALGSKAEQLINVAHTQNKKNNFNFGFDYRFINSPGAYKNQNNAHNNLRANAAYQSPNRKYGAFLIFISNKHVSAENGGLVDPTQVDKLALNDPFELETRMGISGAASRNPFSNSITTGNEYHDNTILFRHFYDLGKKDSIVTDSITYKIFYPRLRLQHTMNISGYGYLFKDQSVDSTRYHDYYGITFLPSTTTKNLLLEDRWSNFTNEFSVITFPDKNNQSQFLKVGAGLQSLKATLASSTIKDYNIYLNGEYRNRTRNQVWDIEATGSLYLTGFNSGDYSAYISLKRLLTKKLGYLELGFQNVNRTPSFIFSPDNSFLVHSFSSLKKENTARLFARYENPKQHFVVAGEYFLVNNYAYFDSFFRAQQASTLFNVLHLSLEKKFRLSKHFNLYTEIHIQPTTGNPPVHLPFFLTRNRIALEDNGKFFQNLFLSTGLELRYYTNYKADNYSPFTGQFFYQESFTTANRPDINVFLHFRIKSFKAFVRYENLNTLLDGKSKYNFNFPNYANTGGWTRFGVWWNFVN
jgi:hypothetical protein